MRKKTKNIMKFKLEKSKYYCETNTVNTEKDRR